MLKEFKEFLIKGNAIDMAVGFIFGAAFAGVVKSIIDNLIMPPIGLALGKVDFSNLFISLNGNHYASLTEATKVGAPVIKYGVVITDIINFVILGLIVFMMIKGISKLQSVKEESKSSDSAQTVQLLSEIRDILKK